MRLNLIKLFCIFYLFSPVILLGRDGEPEIPNYSTPIYCFDVSPENNLLYYYAGGQIISYSLKDKRVVQEIEFSCESSVISIFVQPYGELAFLGTKSGKLYAVNTTSGEILMLVDHGTTAITALAMSSDGSALLCACANGKLYKHSVSAIDQFSCLYEHREAITSVEVSKPKQLIAVSSGDGTISIFMDETFELVDELSAGKNWIREVAFNNKNGHLLSVGDDGRLRVWNIENSENIKLINETRVSGNWLLSVNVGYNDELECWGGLDQELKVRLKFGAYSKKLKGPILQTKIIGSGSFDNQVICCVAGKGIQLVPLSEMKFKSNYD